MTIPTSWVERIFERLECIYKERWVSLYGDLKKKDLYTIMWSNGLSGLSANEIKKAIQILKSYPDEEPPTVMDFFHIAKGKRLIKPCRRTDESRGDLDIAHQYLGDIKRLLTNKYQGSDVPRRTE